MGGTLRGRTAVVVLSVTMLTGLLSCTAEQDDPPAPAAPTRDAAGLAAPDEGSYLGMHFSATLPDRKQQLLDLEDGIGREVALDRVYHRFDERFPTAYDAWTVAQGRTPFIGWSCRTAAGAPVSWRAIADGELDDVVDARAADLTELGVPVLMSFCHEPGTFEGEDAAGTRADFVAAWRHLVERFDAAGAPVSWAWTLTAYEFRAGAPDEWYPGDDVVDWVGVDGYVNVDCPWLQVPWRTWTETFAAAHAFADEHAKPLVVAEFSLREDPADPDRKGRWLADAAAEVAAMPRLRAVVGFNSEESCSDHVASTDEALAGLRELAHSDALSATPGG